MPRKNGFSVLAIAILIASVGFVFHLFNHAHVPASVSGRRQITRDGLVKSNLASDGSVKHLERIHSFQQSRRLVAAFPDS